MADVMYFPDGTREVVIGDPGELLLRLIRERLGEDAAQLFLSYTGSLGVFEATAEENERLADGYLSLCRDTREDFRQLAQELQKPRIDRKALSSMVERSFQALNRNL